MKAPPLPPPTMEFLAELVLRARVYGHAGDYPALVQFIWDIWPETQLPGPEDWEPFDVEDPPQP